VHHKQKSFLILSNLTGELNQTILPYPALSKDLLKIFQFAYNF